MNRRWMFFLCGLVAVLTIAVLWLTRPKPDSSAEPATRMEPQGGNGVSFVCDRPSSPPTGQRSAHSARSAAPAPSMSVWPPSGRPTAVARVSQSGRQQESRPNQLGNFPRTYIEPNATVPVEVVFSQGNPGQTVVLEAKDGGHFGCGELAQVMKLDEHRRVAFTFHADEQPGIYRVSMRCGSQEKVLPFWVGAPPPVVER